MLVQRPRGTVDLLPPTTERWQAAEEMIREQFRRYHYREIRTPVFEYTELFSRGVGDSTDIVRKEMYTFPDQAGRSLTLRPEGTAGVVRAYVENKLYGAPDVTKLYYVEAVFRHEKPQRGRERQFHQYGCEALGSDNPSLDAEVIALNLSILHQLGISNAVLELNSVGCAHCRPRHRELMLAALEPRRQELCAECQDRLDRNPLRIFDCKHEHCQQVLRASNAPTILEVLCDDCRSHFALVCAQLDTLSIPYVSNGRLVRGLDYYTRTAWEILSASGSALSGGGRYNHLAAMLGGPETPGVGFAASLERAFLALDEAGQPSTLRPPLDVYIVVVDDSAAPMAARLLQDLRQAGVKADRDYLGRGVKAQLRSADREQAPFVAILGDAELANKTVSVKTLADGVQVEIDRATVVSYLQQRVGERS